MAARIQKLKDFLSGADVREAAKVPKVGVETNEAKFEDRLVEDGIGRKVPTVEDLNGGPIQEDQVADGDDVRFKLTRDTSKAAYESLDILRALKEHLDLDTDGQAMSMKGRILAPSEVKQDGDHPHPVDLGPLEGAVEEQPAAATNNYLVNTKCPVGWAKCTPGYSRNRAYNMACTQSIDGVPLVWSYDEDTNKVTRCVPQPLAASRAGERGSAIARLVEGVTMLGRSEDWLTQDNVEAAVKRLDDTKNADKFRGASVKIKGKREKMIESVKLTATKLRAFVARTVESTGAYKVPEAARAQILLAEAGGIRPLAMKAIENAVEELDLRALRRMQAIMDGSKLRVQIDDAKYKLAKDSQAYLAGVYSGAVVQALAPLIYPVQQDDEGDDVNEGERRAFGMDETVRRSVAWKLAQVQAISSPNQVITDNDFIRVRVEDGAEEDEDVEDAQDDE